MLHSAEFLPDKEREKLEFLREDFCGLFDADKKGEAAELFKKIVKEYQSENRAYHNLDHIEKFLGFLEKFRQKIKDTKGVKLAVWFHDIIYDTEARDNEDQSAEYAQTFLRMLGVSEKVIAHVVALIKATAKYELVEDDPDSAIFLDGDLEILGSSDDEYNSYAEKIRREYARVPDDQYREGRKRILENFLNRQRMYFTDEAGKELEQPARRNIEKELMKLK